MNRITEEDSLFMANGEGKAKLIARKREFKLSYKDITEELAEEVREIVNIRRFYNEYEILLDVKKGEVFNIQFLGTCGSELHGEHFVVALADSAENNPVVLVAPLSSYKGKDTLNPRSDLYIGYVKGILNGKESIVIINQIQAIDKTRFVNPTTLHRFDAAFEENKLPNSKESRMQLKNRYRLTKEQLRYLQRSLVSYFFTGLLNNEKID